MKPLNLDDPGCTAMSSNCVIWQGPDIPCISLCKGDTISDITFKLATLLCDLIKDLDVTTFDLSCFNTTSCAPKNIHDLIQFLISRICNLEACTKCAPDCNGNTPTPTNPANLTGCPDCEMRIAVAFQYRNRLGDIVTTMGMTDYVTTIGNKVSDQVSQISTLQAVTNSQGARIGALESATPPVVTLPTITPTCVLPAVPTEMNVVLSALEQQFCELRGATGNPVDIYTAISQQCAGLTNDKALGISGGIMSSYSGWSTDLPNLAAVLGNMWITVCDLRSAVKNIQLTCCPQGCAGISINLQGVLAGNIATIYLTGSIPTGFQNCNPLGALITVKDTSGGSITTRIDLVSYMNNPSGFPINLGGTPINLSDNLSIHIDSCLTNPSTNATCEDCLDLYIVNQLNCPTITYGPSFTTITYTGSIITGTATYTVELWDNTTSTEISSQVQTITGPGTLSGTFLGLTSDTIYKLRVRVTTASGETVCPFTPVTTLPPVCPAPTGASAEITITEE